MDILFLAILLLSYFAFIRFDLAKKSLCLGAASGLIVFGIFLLRELSLRFIAYPAWPQEIGPVIEEAAKILVLLFLLSKTSSPYKTAFGIGLGFSTSEHICFRIIQGALSPLRIAFSTPLHILTLFSFLFVSRLSNPSLKFRTVRILCAAVVATLLHIGYNFLIQQNS